MRSLPALLPLFAATCLAAGSARAQGGEDPRKAEIEEIRARLAELERRSAEPGTGVDLTDRQVGYGTESPDANPLGRPWYEKLDVWGYGAFTYLDTGSVGEHPDGAFLIQEASVFAEAHPWERIVLHAELRGAVVGYDFLSTGELYADARRLWAPESGDFASLRAGRFYVPFGAETLWFRAPENPLVSYSAAFPWGLDEGVEAYGTLHGVEWMVAVTSGTSGRGVDNGPGKTWNLRLSGRPCEHLELDGNLMLQGKTSSSAIDFGGSNITPVGAGASSSAGTSPSALVDGTLGEVGAKVLWPSRGSLGLTFGHASIDDEVNAFDRDFRWFRIEPRYDLTPEVFAVLRYSEIGTYDSDEGYHFDGLMIADAEPAFGYDVRRFQRISGGLGWKPNPNTLVKLEVGKDRFWVIDGSPANPDAGERTFFALGLVVSF